MTNWQLQLAIHWIVSSGLYSLSWQLSSQTPRGPHKRLEELERETTAFPKLKMPIRAFQNKDTNLFVFEPICWSGKDKYLPDSNG